MRTFRTFLYALAVAALAACGGGPGAVVPPGAAVPPGASALGTRDPSGSTVAFEKRTLWVAHETLVEAFPTNGIGAVAPQQILYAFPSYDSSGRQLFGPCCVVDVAVAPDGTRWLLQKMDPAGSSGWRLYAVAPGDNQPENTYGDDVHRPSALALGGDGPAVAYESRDGTTTIATYAYAASNSSPVRTLHLTGQVFGFAAGNHGQFYVARPNAFDVYRPIPNGWVLAATIPTTTPSASLTINPRQFAVGPDDSLYMVDLPGSGYNRVMYVNVYPRGSGTVGRRIGPLPAAYDGFNYPVIAVDAMNRLYVETEAQIYRFGQAANGAAKPQRVMTDPDPDDPAALAVGPSL